MWLFEPMKIRQSVNSSISSDNCWPPNRTVMQRMEISGLTVKMLCFYCFAIDFIKEEKVMVYNKNDSSIFQDYCIIIFMKIPKPWDTYCWLSWIDIIIWHKNITSVYFYSIYSHHTTGGLTNPREPHLSWQSPLVPCPRKCHNEMKFSSFLKKQEAPGPHCSPEKTFQINKHIWLLNFRFSSLFA